jgi:hypothetical protein
MLIGLLLAIAFLGHDVLMIAPNPASAAENSPPTLTVGSFNLNVSHPHPHGCGIGQAAALKTPDAPLRQSITSLIIVHSVLPRPAGLPSFAAATQARSPTTQRAVLQVFRI